MSSSEPTAAQIDTERAAPSATSAPAATPAPPSAKPDDLATTGVTPPRPPMPAHSLARILLGVTGLVWMVIGLWGLADPKSLADIVDLEIDSPLGRLEIRAMYGGFCVALGILHGLAASRRAWLMQGLVATAIMTTGLLSGRLLTVALDGVPGPTGLLLIGSEAGLVAVLCVGIWRLMVASRAAKKAAKQAAKAAE